jgi:hypothetical protein
MKRLLLICFSWACALVAVGCASGGGGAVNSGTGGAGNVAGAGGGAGNVAGAGTGGSAGNAGAGTGGQGAAGPGGQSGAAGAPGGSAGTGSVCPAPQPLSGTECRSATECPGGGREYYCTTDPAGVLSACASQCISPPPHHDCTVDTDCPTGDICVSLPTPCCSTNSTSCQVSCSTAGFTCPAGTVCAPGTKSAGANGCAPQLCDAGYTCPTGFQCAVGVLGADVHGCAEKPCSQTGCPINFVCLTTATIGGCTAKKCATDSDCDACGFCVEQACASRLGACVMPRS